MKKKFYGSLCLAILSFFLYSCDSGSINRGGDPEGPGAPESSRGKEVDENAVFFTKFSEKAPDFTLTNYDGRKVSLSDYKGKVVVMTYVYTRCKHICPGMERKYLAIQREFAGELGSDLVLMFITVDPKNDTEKVLGKRASTLDADPAWLFLTGTEEEVKSVLNSYYVMVMKAGEADFTHPQRINIIDRSGELIYRLARVLERDIPSEVLMKKVREALAQ